MSGPTRLPSLARELRRETATTLQAIEETSAVLGNTARRYATRHPLAAIGLGLGAGYALGSRTGRWLSAGLVASAGRITFATALSSLARGLAGGAAHSHVDGSVPAGTASVANRYDKENEA
jgi:hypothetical protein